MPSYPPPLPSAFPVLPAPATGRDESPSGGTNHCGKPCRLRICFPCLLLLPDNGIKKICKYLKNERVNLLWHPMEKKTLTKSDIMEKLARLRGINLRDAERSVNAAFDSMSKALAKGNRIEIRGFGSFQAKDYDQYAGHNPKTGVPIIIAAKRLPFFKPGKELKERVGRKYEELNQTPARKS